MKQKICPLEKLYFSSVPETRKLLKVCNLNDLYPRSPRDSVIIFCLNNKLSLIQTNEKLEDFGQDILD